MSRFYEDLYISWIILFSEISFHFQVTGRIGKNQGLEEDWVLT